MIFVLIAIVIFGTDMLLKNYADSNLTFGSEKPVWKGKILLTRYHNRGAAMNFMQEKKEWLLALSSAVFGAVIVLFAAAFRKKGSGLYQLGLACIAGGAASNLADRVRKGYVVDYFSFSFLRRIIFNIGDLFIFLGSAILMILELGNNKR